MCVFHRPYALRYSNGTDTDQASGLKDAQGARTAIDESLPMRDFTEPNPILLSATRQRLRGYQSFIERSG